ncbi:hypothetical protein Hanom_Chr06g00511881 [Helianthus anomalus]
MDMVRSTGGNDFLIKGRTYPCLLCWIAMTEIMFLGLTFKFSVFMNLLTKVCIFISIVL